jgi:hypothetical protein
MTVGKKTSASRNSEKPKALKFTISCGSGDGAYLCFKSVSTVIHNYFVENDIDLEEYVLDYDYADAKNIPENMQPFEAGRRASFGSYECGMTASDDLELIVEDEDFNEIYSGTIPKKNIKRDKQGSEALKDREKGIYIVGYEGLEDCYISGQIELNTDFDVKKFKVNYRYLDYELGDREMISSITYDGVEVDWSLDSYEGTGDNSFGFVEVKNQSVTILDND